MASPLTEALQKRARQWAAFNEWEEGRSNVPTLNTADRVAWYVEAYELANKLSVPPKDPDKREKAERVRSLHERLARR